MIPIILIFYKNFVLVYNLIFHSNNLIPNLTKLLFYKGLQQIKQLQTKLTNGTHACKYETHPNRPTILFNL
jgi:hypothetical protein